VGGFDCREIFFYRKIIGPNVNVSDVPLDDVENTNVVSVTQTIPPTDVPLDDVENTNVVSVTHPIPPILPSDTNLPISGILEEPV